MTGIYGNGDFGYGVFGVSNPVNTDVNTAAPEQSGAVSKFVPYPQFRNAAAVAEFWGSASLHPIAYARGFVGQSELLASAYVQPQPQFRPDPAVPEIVTQVLYWSGAIYSNSQARMELQGYARAVPEVLFRGAQAPLELGSRLRLAAFFKMPGRVPSRLEYGGRTGPLRTVVVIRPQRARVELHGAARGTVWPTMRTRARVQLVGANRFKARFVFPVSPARIEMVAHVTIAYAWSDLTNPGRYPVPDWQEAPADPGGAWFEVTAAADPWQEVPMPSQN
jgi:hypothetical protein